MSKPKKEMKITYETAMETEEKGNSIDEAFDLLFDEVFKLNRTGTAAQYA